MGVVVAVAAAVWIIAPRLRNGDEPATSSTTASRARWLFVYGAGADGPMLVGNPGRRRPLLRSAACVKLPVDAMHFAERDDDLVILDRPQPALLLLSRDFLRRVGAGTASCTASDPSPVRRIPLHSGRIPNRATMAGDRLMISFFKDNLVEEYTWVPAQEGAEATALFVRDIAFRTPEDLGLGDLMVVGQRLLVAGRKRLFAIPHRNALWPFVDTRPSNSGANALYRHPSSDVWLIAAGEPGGYGSVQQVIEVDPPTLEAEVRLPDGSDPVAGYALGADHFVVVQRSGEHLFVFDARDGRLAKILRFNGSAFVGVDRDLPKIPAGAGSELRQLLADPDAARELYLVDGKREQLLRVHVAGDGLTLEGTVRLGDGKGRRAPRWAAWL